MSGDYHSVVLTGQSLCANLVENSNDQYHPLTVSQAISSQALNYSLLGHYPKCILNHQVTPLFVVRYI